MTLAVREAGKTLNDALAEVREAVDFWIDTAERRRVGQGKARWKAADHAAELERLGELRALVSP